MVSDVPIIFCFLLFFINYYKLNGHFFISWAYEYHSKRYKKQKVTKHLASNNINVIYQQYPGLLKSL